MNLLPEIGTLPTPAQIRNALRVVVDPEVGVNIVELGLVYEVEVTPAEVKVLLTMTSPACPLSDLVIADAENALQEVLDPAIQVTIELIWSPPWEPAMMSDKARETLGW
ncbi:MAG: hydroxylase [Betaproteobacteria bacterium HGW-Betaproteobacteria-10]|jgi:metal-sulfur cluster biosynthetic enzyme|nr:MAG: hydroxylase [Betaproteobacteria bacterium HGW-Betaproteobacteria-10]